MIHGTITMTLKYTKATTTTTRNYSDFIMIHGTITMALIAVEDCEFAWPLNWGSPPHYKCRTDHGFFPHLQEQRWLIVFANTGHNGEFVRTPPGSQALDLDVKGRFQADAFSRTVRSRQATTEGNVPESAEWMAGGQSGKTSRTRQCIVTLA